MDIKSRSGAVHISSSYTCHTRLFKPTDKFFEDGDVYCSLQSKQLFRDAEDESQRVCEFQCHVAGCSQLFNTLPDYESHYNSVHRNVCRICHRVLPSNHLLEIHVLEWHDTLFDVLAERQPMFQCLVQGCPERFRNQGARKDHLVSSHQYPKNFRFDKKLNYKSVPSRDCGDDVMEVGMNDEDKERDNRKGLPRKQRVPAHISFGRGGSRTFQRKPRNQIKTENIPRNTDRGKGNPLQVVDTDCTEEMHFPTCKVVLDSCNIFNILPYSLPWMKVETYRRSTLPDMREEQQQLFNDMDSLWLPKEPGQVNSLNKF